MKLLPRLFTTWSARIKPEIGPSMLLKEIRRSSENGPLSAFTGTKMMSPTAGVIGSLASERNKNILAGF